MPQDTMGDETYLMKTLLDFLGISRSTLRYYEQIGIVRPSRNEQSNYRSYSVTDIYRVAGSFMLKNAGYPVQDAPALLDEAGSPFELVDRLIDCNERELAWHQAVKDSLKRLRRVCRNAIEGNPPRLTLVDTWLAYYDKGETSYKNFDAESPVAALLQGMPVTSFGSVFDGHAPLEGIDHPYRSFRCVPARFARLFPDLTKSGNDPDEIYGGCVCAVMSNLMRYEDIRLLTTEAPYLETFARYFEDEGLEPVYPAFSINAWPIIDAIYCEINLPVRPKTLHGIAAVRRAKRRGIE